MAAARSDDMFGMLPPIPRPHQLLSFPFPPLVTSETLHLLGPITHPHFLRIQERVILHMQVWFSCQPGVHGTLGEARAASRAKMFFPSAGFYLSLPG